MTADTASSGRVTVLMPLYEDWQSVKEVLRRLDAALRRAERTARVLVVDDASPSRDTGIATNAAYHAIESVDILTLRRNLGHQRAIAVGLARIDADAAADTVVIMDSDGEDSPADVLSLLSAFEDHRRSRIVFAERRRRSEGITFTLFYAIFRFAHRILTGHRVRVGNFSVLSARAIRSLVVVPELWNHYAAAVFISGLPYTTVPTDRGRRIAGKSKMGFVRLVMHGLSAISVFSDVVSVRVLLASGIFLAIAFIAAVAGAAGLGLGSFFLPDWAKLVLAVLSLAFFQGIAFILLFSFTILSSRKGATVLLARDYVYFVDEVKRAFP